MTRCLTQILTKKSRFSDVCCSASKTANSGGKWRLPSKFLVKAQCGLYSQANYKEQCRLSQTKASLSSTKWFLRSTEQIEISSLSNWVVQLPKIANGLWVKLQNELTHAWCSFSCFTIRRIEWNYFNSIITGIPYNLVEKRRPDASTQQGEIDFYWRTKHIVCLRVISVFRATDCTWE